MIESNQSVSNTIYLDVIAKENDEFTTDQMVALFSIANQCPMAGGNAVFQARSMYRLIDDTYVFDDAQLCLAHGILVRSAQVIDQTLASVIPNPAKDEATLVLEQPLEEPGFFVLYNVVGAEVMRMAVAVNVQRTAFSTDGLAPGMYHYVVTVPIGTIGQGKWSIVR